MERRGSFRYICTVERIPNFLYTCTVLVHVNFSFSPLSPPSPSLSPPQDLTHPTYKHIFTVAAIFALLPWQRKPLLFRSSKQF